MNQFPPPTSDEDAPPSMPPEGQEELSAQHEWDRGSHDESNTEMSQPALAGAPVSYTILGVCVLLFLLSQVVRLIPLEWLVFSPGNGLVLPGLISHMFAHANSMHLLGNMLVLYFLGTIIERSYGATRYLALYFVSGLFAAAAEGAASPEGLLLGASGALAGVMAAFVRHYPNVKLYIWGILPLPAWLFILFWLAFNMFGAGMQNSLHIAFSAHLGGFFAGLIMSLLLLPPGKPFTRILP